MIIHLPEKNKHLLPRTASKEQWEELIISLMRQYVAENDTITYNDFRDWIPGRSLARTAERTFGSWNAALRAAGFPTKKRWRINDEYILNCIKSCYNENGYISYNMLNSTKYGIHISTIERHFGSFKKAIEKAGVPHERSIYEFATKTKAKDGHECDSMEETILDDWLYDNNISHEVHTDYPRHDVYNNGKMSLRSDFQISNNCIIEYFGMYELSNKRSKMRNIRRDYKKTITRKIALCKELDIKLYSVYRKDLKNLGEVLSSLLIPSNMDNESYCVTTCSKEQIEEA